MAYSGSFNYSRTAAQIITTAYENLGVIIPGGTVATAHSDTALVRLNHIVKELSGTADGVQGMKVHLRKTVTLLLAKGQQTYSVGPASGDARASTAVGRTTIRTAEAAAQTVLDITATTDTTTYPGTTVSMTASDIIGIEQNDGTIFYSTISSTGAGPTVTIGTGLDAAAAAGNYVWWFTSRAQRFPVIESATLRDESYNETPLEIYRDVRAYQQGVVDKYADGDPTAILVEPLLIATRVTLDSQPTDVTKQIILYVQYPQEDYDATSDDIALPQEWLRRIEWELTMALAPVFGKVWTPAMEMNYRNSVARTSALNPEVSDLYFRPN